MAQVYQVVICEDHHLIIDGLKAILTGNDEFVVMGSAHSELELVVLLKNIQPDVLILDINLGAEDGFTILKKIRPLYPDLRVMILTMHDDPYILEKARDLGANGFLLKSSTVSELMTALHGLFETDFYEDPKLKSKRTSSELSRNGFVAKMKLTKRELEIIKMMVQGLTSDAIGKKLFVSVHTVRTHKKNILKKLGVVSAAEVVSYAFKNNLT